MILLGKPISSNTEALILEIEGSLKKPVHYAFTDPKKTSSFGQSDPWQPDSYYVYCKESLLNLTKRNQPNIPFETNILHELFHLCQAEEGFPYTGTKYNKMTEGNMDFFDRMGSLFSSTILDLDVDFRLKSNGYSSEYFYKNRIKRAEKLIMKGVTCSTNDDFVQYACMLTCLNLQYRNSEMDNLLNLYQKKIPNLVFCILKMSEEISKIGYNDAVSTFNSLCYLFDSFNLWASHVVYFNGTTYQSSPSAQ